MVEIDQPLVDIGQPLVETYYGEGMERCAV